MFDTFSLFERSLEIIQLMYVILNIQIVLDFFGVSNDETFANDLLMPWYDICSTQQISFIPKMSSNTIRKYNKNNQTMDEKIKEIRLRTMSNNTKFIKWFLTICSSAVESSLWWISCCCIKYCRVWRGFRRRSSPSTFTTVWLIFSYEISLAWLRFFIS